MSLQFLGIRCSRVSMDTNGAGLRCPLGCTSGGLAPLTPSGTPFEKHTASPRRYTNIGARGWDAAGRTWCWDHGGPTGGCTPRPVGPPREFHRQTRAVNKYWARLGLRFWTSLSSCSSCSSSNSSTRSWRCPGFRSSTAWWFASAFSCATETVRTVQTAQKTRDVTGAVLGDVVDTPVDVSTRGVMVQTVQKTVWRCRVRRGCGRPCDHRCITGSSEQFLVKLRWLWRGLFPHFAAFFALRPDGRECSFFSPRWPTVVGDRGLRGSRSRGEFYSGVTRHKGLPIHPASCALSDDVNDRVQNNNNNTIWEAPISQAGSFHPSLGS